MFDPRHVGCIRLQPGRLVWSSRVNDILNQAVIKARHDHGDVAKGLSFRVPEKSEIHMTYRDVRTTTQM
jgi:hypothetical protein